MFYQTRLRLTLQSIVIVMSLSFIFSFAIYGLLHREVTRFSQLQRFRVERRITGSRGQQIVATFPADFPPFVTSLQWSDPQLEQEILHNIQLALIGVNGCVLLIAGILSYIVAGKSLRPIQKMVEEQKEFMNAASHELRTPLTALKLSSEVALRNPKLNLTQAKALLKENLLEVERLQNLTTKLLQFQSTMQVSERQQWQSISLSSLLHSALKQVTPMANVKHQKITLQIRGGNIFGNAQELAEVLVILLDNAIKYSPSKSVITITQQGHTHSSAARTNWTQLQICDQGMGISDVELSHIFEKFYRGDTSRPKLVPGFGLGLAIAKQIVERHGGKLFASNLNSGGACFTLQLPLG